SHWGMARNLTASDVARAYPNLDRWRQVRSVLTSGGAVATFDNAFSDQCGLSTTPSNAGESLGGVATSAPAASSWASGRLDVFVRGTTNALYHKYWDGSRWQGWDQLGVDTFASGPAAVSWGPNRIDVFARGIDNALHHIFWDGSRWSN